MKDSFRTKLIRFFHLEYSQISLTFRDSSCGLILHYSCLNFSMTCALDFCYKFIYFCHLAELEVLQRTFPMSNSDLVSHEETFSVWLHLLHMYLLMKIAFLTAVTSATDRRILEIQTLLFLDDTFLGKQCCLNSEKQKLSLSQSDQDVSKSACLIVSIYLPQPTSKQKNLCVSRLNNNPFLTWIMDVR